MIPCGLFPMIRKGTGSDTLPFSILARACRWLQPPPSVLLRLQEHKNMERNNATAVISEGWSHYNNIVLKRE
jgi:hypothetical protein